MFTLSWRKPSQNDQKSCLARSRSTELNYDSKYVGRTVEAPIAEKDVESLRNDGFVINHTRVKLGSGSDVYRKAKDSLTSWRHFQMSWASVDPSTPIAADTRYCNCVQELYTWILNPMKVLYVEDTEDRKIESEREACNTALTGGGLGLSKHRRCFAYGSGTLRGHLLAGEERFGVEWNADNDTVSYDIYSFSKPAHPLAALGYPIVRYKQALFAKKSTEAMLQAVAESDPPTV